MNEVRITDASGGMKGSKAPEALLERWEESFKRARAIYLEAKVIVTEL